MKTTLNKNLIKYYLKKILFFLFINSLSLNVFSSINIQNDLNSNSKINEELIYEISNQYYIFLSMSSEEVFNDIIKFYELDKFNKKSSKITAKKEILNFILNFFEFNSKFYDETKNIFKKYVNSLNKNINESSTLKDLSENDIKNSFLNLFSNIYFNNPKINFSTKDPKISIKFNRAQSFIWSLYVGTKLKKNILDLPKELLEKIFLKPIIDFKTSNSIENIRMNDFKSILLKNSYNTDFFDIQFKNEIFLLNSSIENSISLIKNRQKLIKLINSQSNLEFVNKIDTLLKEISLLQKEIKKLNVDSIEQSLNEYVPKNDFYLSFPISFFPLIGENILSMLPNNLNSSNSKYAIYSFFVLHNSILGHLFSEYNSQKDSPARLTPLNSIQEFFGFKYPYSGSFNNIPNITSFNSPNLRDRFSKIVLLNSFAPVKFFSFPFYWLINKGTTLIDSNKFFVIMGLKYYKFYKNFEKIKIYFKHINQLISKSKALYLEVEKLYLKNNIDKENFLPEIKMAESIFKNEKTLDSAFIKKLDKISIGKESLSNKVLFWLTPGLLARFYFIEFKNKQNTFNKIFSFISTIDLAFAKNKMIQNYGFCLPKIKNYNDIKLKIDNMFFPSPENISRKIYNNIDLNKINKNMLITAPFGAGKTTYLANTMLCLYISRLGIAPAKSMDSCFFSNIIDLINIEYIIGEDTSRHIEERKKVKQMNNTIENSKNLFTIVFADELYSGTSKQCQFAEAKSDIGSALKNNNVIFLLTTHNSDYIYFANQKENRMQSFYCPVLVSNIPGEEGKYILPYTVIPDDSNNWWLNTSYGENHRKYTEFMDEKRQIDKLSNKEY